jgi:Cysteine rich repeat
MNFSGAIKLRPYRIWNTYADPSFVRRLHRLLPAHIPLRSQEMGDLRTYCISDIQRLCKGIAPGGGRILKCLKANKKEMSVGCAQALQKLKAKKQ